jgi:acetyltransferase-like isoleucine patch superfamily enzyme
LRWRALIQLLLLALPWIVRRPLLEWIFGYEIHPSARIGFSIIAPYARLELAEGARIGHLNVARGMDTISLGKGAIIGRLNWIYAIPGHFDELAHETDRVSELVLGEEAAIASRHIVDCSCSVNIREFATIGGHRSQILTHAADLRESRVVTLPIEVGAYSLVGSGAILLGGSRLPAFSALGAGSTLRDDFSQTHTIYSGVPAVPSARIDESNAWFHRKTGPLSPASA